MSCAMEKLRISSGAFSKLTLKAGDKEKGKSDPSRDDEDESQSLSG